MSGSTSKKAFMAGFAPGTKRKSGDSAFARRLLSAVRMDSLRRDPTHLSALSRKFANKSTRADDTFDSMTSSRENSFEKQSEASAVPNRSADALRKRKQQSHSPIAALDDPVVPRIQRRPMQFFPTTSPALTRRKESSFSANHNSNFTSRRINSMENLGRPLVDVMNDGESNDSLASKSVRQPQHEEEGISTLDSQIVGEFRNTSLRCVSRDSSRDNSPASTLMNNKSDMDGYSDFTGAPTEIATNRAVDTVMNKIREMEDEDGEGTNNYRLSDLIKQRAGYLASRRQLQTQIALQQPQQHYWKQMDDQPRYRRHLANNVRGPTKSLSCNEGSSRTRSPDPQNDTNLAQTRIPVMKAIFRPRSESDAVHKPSWHNERKRGALLIPELQSFSSQQHGSSDGEEKETLLLRNKLSTETPDPVFCSYPESPSTRGCSFGSDYVSTADFADRSMISPSQRDNQTVEEDFSGISGGCIAGSTIVYDDSAVTLKRNGSDDAVVLNSFEGQQAPDRGITDFLRPRYLTGGAVLVPVANNEAMDQSKVQNYAPAVKRLNQMWPPNRTDTSCVNKSKKKDQNQSLSAPDIWISNEKESLAAQKPDVLNNCGTLSTEKGTLSSYLSRDSLDVPAGSMQSSFVKLSKALENEFDSDDDDGGSVRSLKEKFEKGIAYDDDDDDSGSVRSLKEKFEKLQRSTAVKTDVKKLAAMFESKKSRANRRFECENVAIKNAYSKFEDLHMKSKRAPARSSDKIVIENIPRAAKSDEDSYVPYCLPNPEVSSVEKEGSHEPHVSVADRIRAFTAANSGSAFKSRSPIKRAGKKTNSQSTMEKSHITETRSRTRTNERTLLKERDHEPIVSDDFTEASIFQTHFQSDEHIYAVSSDVVAKAPSSPTLDIPDTISPTQPFMNRLRPASVNATAEGVCPPARGARPVAVKSKVSPVFTTPPLPAKAAYASSQQDRSKVPSYPTVLISPDTVKNDHVDSGSRLLVIPVKEKPKVRSGAWSTTLVATGSVKRTVVDPVKYTKSIPSDPLLIARRLVKNNFPSVKRNPVKPSADGSISGSDEFSDGVTLDVSIAEVSNLTVSTALSSVVPCMLAADLSGSVAANKTKSSSSPNSGLTPSLLSQVVRMKQTSDEKVADVPFICGSSSKNVNDLVPTFDQVNENTWDSGWDLHQIVTSFPDTNTSCTDIFEFDSEWQSSPTREKPDLNPITSTISQRRNMVDHGSTHVARESPVVLSGKPRKLDGSDRVSGKGELLHQDEAAHPKFSHAEEACVTSASITARDYSDKKKRLPAWKRRLGVSSPAPQSESKRPKPILVSDLTKPARINGLPPRGKQSPSTNSSAEYSNLMSRLMKLKQTRKLREASAYSVPVDSSPSRSTTRLSCAYTSELDDFSSSSFSSTRFGGSAFMEALEVD